MDGGACWAAVHGVAKSRTRLSDFTFTFHFHALEKEMATHSSILAWRIPGIGEPGGLPSLGSHRVGHDWSDLAAAAAAEVQRVSIICFWEFKLFVSLHGWLKGLWSAVSGKWPWKSFQWRKWPDNITCFTANALHIHVQNKLLLLQASQTSLSLKFNFHCNNLVSLSDSKVSDLGKQSIK